MRMGVEERLLGWLASYLEDHKFKVFIGNVYSSARRIRSGVPQGAILSPVLFNVMVTDIVKGVWNKLSRICR